MGGIFTSIFGNGSKVESTAATVTEEERKANKARNALYATESGVSGQELQAQDVSKRNTLLGN